MAKLTGEKYVYENRYRICSVFGSRCRIVGFHQQCRIVGPHQQSICRLLFVGTRLLFGWSSVLRVWRPSRMLRNRATLLRRPERMLFR
ncbi:MAG: hypothetical protein IH899_15120 [Planctomycetes bacterium]|nr:hypothetical protein [Planctomycetota bacterium]